MTRRSASTWPGQSDSTGVHETRTSPRSCPINFLPFDSEYSMCPRSTSKVRTILVVDAIDVHYGDFQALYRVSVMVEGGETLLGRANMYEITSYMAGASNPTCREALGMRPGISNSLTPGRWPSTDRSSRFSFPSKQISPRHKVSFPRPALPGTGQYDNNRCKADHSRLKVGNRACHDRES